MIYLRRIIIVFFAVALVGVAANYTLARNLEAGLYPVDADSIGLPSIATVVSFALLLVLMVAAIGVTRLGKNGGRRKRFFLRCFLVVLYALAFLLAGEGMVNWFIPHHYVIGCAYAFVVVLAVVRIISDMRELTLNSSLNPDLQQDNAASRHRL